MKCPYCDREMKAGFLKGTMSSMMLWMPKTYYQQHVFTPNSKKTILQEGGIIFTSGMDALGGTVFYVCEDCGKMIAELEKQEKS